MTRAQLPCPWRAGQAEESPCGLRFRRHSAVSLGQQPQASPTGLRKGQGLVPRIAGQIYGAPGNPMPHRI